MHVIAAQMQAQRGKAVEAAGFVTNARDVISKATGQPAYAWRVVLGAPTGAYAISGRIEGFAGWVSMTQTLAEDPAYMALDAAAAGVLEGPTLTQFSEVVAATSTDTAPKQFATVTSVVIANGAFSAAGAWAAEVLQLVTDITGTGGMLAVASTGQFGQLTWFMGTDTAEEIDDVNAKLAADPSYAAKLDTSTGLFVEGSGLRAVLAQMP